MLELILGPMFSGKSTELISRIRKLRVLGRHFLVVKPAIDNRYTTENFINTHNSETERCLTATHLGHVDFNGYDAVFIDEGQFFSDLYEVISKVVDNKNMMVVVAGLNGDSNRQKFGQINDLVPLADNIVFKTSYCKVCLDGTPAPFSYRIDKKQRDQISVGGTEQYMPLCRKHYLSFTTPSTVSIS